MIIILKIDEKISHYLILDGMQHTLLPKQNILKIIVHVHFPFVVKIGYQTLQLQNPNSQPKL